MKKRTGFVSNSSSSSFIILGIMIKDSNYEELSRKFLLTKSIDDYIAGEIENYTGKDKEDYWEDLWYECASNMDFINENLEYIDNDDKNFLGKILVDDEYLEEGEYSFDELIKLAENFNLDKECKLYYGTRAC